MQGNVSNSDDDRIRWSQQSLDELTETFWIKIAPAMRSDDCNPHTNRPSFAWLSENGFRGLDYALREHHDLTLTEFFRDVVEIGPKAGSGYWGLSDTETAAALEEHIQALADAGDHSEGTLTAKRSRLATVARTFEDRYDDRDLLDASTADLRGVFDQLDETLGSDESKIHYHADASAFFESLDDENPAAGLRDEFAWTRTDGGDDKPTLRRADVRALWSYTEDAGERLLVVGLAGWGLRPGELAALHSSEVEPDDCRVGGNALTERLDELADDADGEYDGPLFPSTRSETGHINADTVWRRFKALAERAEVTVDGETPTPTMARRFQASIDTDDVLSEAFPSGATYCHQK